MKIKEILIWVGVIAVLLGGLWLLILAVNGSPSPSSPVELSGVPEVSENDFVKGNESAKVTLIEYGDFECPACAAYFPIVKQLSAEFPNDLRVVHRFFPLTNIHPNAMLAAQSAYAAGQQNKFWEMHDLLYGNQATWINSNPRDAFMGYAEDLELDLDKFKEDVDSENAKNLINSQQDIGFSIGIGSTPTFFVNGKHIPNPKGYEDLKKIIQDEINKK